MKSLPQQLRFRQIHLDFHTSPRIPGIGEKFDKKCWQETLQDGAVDSITLFSKCHQDSNRVMFRLLNPAEVPVVKSLRKKGYTILKAPAVSRVAIAEALRAERDAR